MADSLALTGSLSVTPAVGNPSGFPSVVIPLDERMVLANSQPSSYSLTVDTPVAVALGGLAEVNFLLVKCVGGKVRVRITSADGSQQSIPVDDLLILKSRSVPITAIDLTRVAGTTTLVEVFLGDSA